ncbi:integrase [Sedimentibacter acidaminivorans]|uniref:Integrase n=1 Tax=Sedimentibacter acidaminivorans TaxID=913099 RepID=A0ABS4GDT8_9FIRM|nr:site-specific integrase [Sedimentibacter acidaminivorans]MBP1925868.1 integrase [Sedimentibacter acidaminivorans]
MANKPKTNANAKGHDYFRVRALMGYDSKGSPVYKNFYGSSKSDAEKMKKKYLDDLEDGLNPDLASQSLSQAMYTWLWDIEKYNGNKSSSFERYESIYRNYIKNSKLGLLVVSEIKKLPVQKYYNSLVNEGKSESQVKNLHKLLNKFYRYAETEGYIIKNPLVGLKLPKGNEEDLDEDDRIVETFTNEEINKILASLENVKLRYIIVFALLTGCRQGEILALKKSDIKGDVIKINKSVRNVKIFDDEENYSHELKVTKPKTKSSNREIPITAKLHSELKKLDKLNMEEKLKLGPAYTANNLLFPSLTGTHIDAKNLRRSWERALDNVGVPRKKFHALRHTYATRLFENGTSILTVSRLLGHSSTRTTEIYTHVLEEVKAKEVECLDAIFY